MGIIQDVRNADETAVKQALAANRHCIDVKEAGVRFNIQHFPPIHVTRLHRMFAKRSNSPRTASIPKATICE
jgi:hypothetical protein